MRVREFSYPNFVEKLPIEVKEIFAVFSSQILLVGGCVRDLILEKEINDFDFATKFTPQEVIEILQRNDIKAVPTGVKYGTVTAVLNQKNFEITTLRHEKNHDGRYFEAEFVDDYFFDAARRDFTINALYLDVNGTVFDYFGGVSDIKKRKVIFIGDCDKRITEDFLRILRFFRFSCEYAISLDNKALEACIKHKINLKKLSRERIRQEFFKLLLSEEKKSLLYVLSEMRRTKIAAEIFTKRFDLKSLEQLFVLEKKCNFSAKDSLKIACLFVDKDTNLPEFFNEICATNYEKNLCNFLAKNFDVEINLDNLKHLLLWHEKDLIQDLYFFLISKKRQKFSKKNLEFLQNFSLPNFPLKAEDLITLGFARKELGEALSLAKNFWAKNNFLPDKKSLLNFLSRAKN
jgi:poly(A) polymerase